MTDTALARRCTLVLLASAIALVGPRRATAQNRPSAPAESAAIIAVAQRLFDAMAARDTAAAHALLVPGATFASVREGVSGTRVQSDTAFLGSLRRGSNQLLERMWTPVVQQHGSIAALIAPYDFHIDRRRTHCGTDAFTMLKTGAGWQIANITYDVQTTGCADSPLGEPPAAPQ